MNLRFLLSLSLGASLLPLLRAADEEPADAPHPSMKEILRARIAEDAQKQAAAPLPPKPGPPAAPAETAPVSAPPANDAAKEKTAAQAPAAKKPGQQPATVLPKVEVKKGRITVLDQMLAKQDEEIAREKKNTKSSEVDLALNDAKVAKPLAVFGGDSAQFRKRVSSERVELMEAEKDVMEAMARAKTKKERDELQKQLDELRAMRRELDKSLR